MMFFTGCFLRHCRRANERAGCEAPMGDERTRWSTKNAGSRGPSEMGGTRVVRLPLLARWGLVWSQEVVADSGRHDTALH